MIMSTICGERSGNYLQVDIDVYSIQVEIIIKDLDTGDNDYGIIYLSVDKLKKLKKWLKRKIEQINDESVITDEKRKPGYFTCAVIYEDFMVCRVHRQGALNVALFCSDQVSSVVLSLDKTKKFMEVLKEADKLLRKERLNGR